VPALEDLLAKKVQFLNDCTGKEVENTCITSSGQQIILLENLRYHIEEEGKGVVNG
jgi:phosphoglycerate kinase